MRITLADKIAPEVASQLASQLNLRLISPSVPADTSIAQNSDDDEIHLIIRQIIDNRPDSENCSGFLINNYPRNVIQAQSLDLALARVGQPISSALMLESGKIALNRTKTALIRYYRSQNKLILFDDTLSMQNISIRIQAIHDKRRTGKSV